MEVWTGGLTTRPRDIEGPQTLATKRKPVLARTDVESGDRFYPWKGEAYWSVTSLIGGGIPKYALAPWYGKVVAELVVADVTSRGPHARAHALVRRWTALGRADFLERQARGELTSLKLEKLSPVELALRHLKGEPVRQRDAAAEIGSDVHSEAEDAVLRMALDESLSLAEHAPDVPVWPERLMGHHDSFHAWLEDYRPIYLATEATVFNRPQAYGGTLDAIVKVRAGRLIDALLEDDIGLVPPWLAAHDPNDWVTLILDYKAGRAVHPEVGLQLAAYARAEFIGLPDGMTELPLPAIDGGAVLHLTPTGYHLRLVRIDDPIFQTFLFAREIFRFRKEYAATVLGPDLAPRRQEATA